MSGKILIVDDVATNRIVLKAKLAGAFYMPLLASDGKTCLQLARSEQPDLILLDQGLRDMTGIEALVQLRGDPATQALPVIILTAQGDTDTRMKAFQAGADDCLPKSVDDRMLLARIRSLVRGRDTGTDLNGPDHTLRAFGLAEAGIEFDRPGLIALVFDEENTACNLQSTLGPLTQDRLVRQTWEDALALSPPSADIFILAMDLNNPGKGLQLMSDLHSRATTRDAVICIVCPDHLAQVSPELAAMAFDLGAQDVVPASICPQEFALRLAKLMRRKRAADRMRASIQQGVRLSMIDPLTGLHNRRYALPYLNGIAERARGAALPYAVLIVDLDRFKRVNDQWGHATGDAVLVQVAKRLSDDLREGDLLARVGGEEFLIGLPDTGEAEARFIAERLCRIVEEQGITAPDGRMIPVTISIGLAISADGLPRMAETVIDVMDRADRALMAAKTSGRNQVTIGQTAA